MFSYIPSTQAIEYGGIGIRPAYPRTDNPRTQSIFVHTLEPGSVTNEGVEVVNNTQQEKRLKVYSTDGTASNDGAFTCKQLSAEKEGVGAWIALEEEEVTLPPLSSKIVNFTINVPEDPLVGENDGCIAMQEIKEVVEGADKQSGVQLSLRTGIRVALTVPGDLRKGVDLLALSVTRNDNGKYVLHPAVKNNGNVGLDVDIQVITRYWTGYKFFENGGGYTLLTRKETKWNYEIPNSFWGGVMISRLYGSYDPNVDTEIGQSHDFNKILVKGPFKLFWMMPSLWGFVIELLILLSLLGLGFLIFLKRKQMAWMKKDWKAYKVKKDETIMTLAKKFNVGWHLLAVKNRIKAPYILVPGDNIWVPSDADKLAVEPVKKDWLAGLKMFKRKPVDTTPRERKMITVEADAGDTIKDVAVWAGISLREFKKLNNITKAGNFKAKPGQEFIVPDPDHNEG